MSRRSRHSRDLLGNVARWYYLHDLSQKEIGKRLDPVKDQAAVARILKEATDRGVVKVDIDADFAIGGVDDDHLAGLLRDEFELRDPLVVDVDATVQQDGREDALHIALANHAGMRMRQTIGSGDHIAISGGRAGVRLATVIGRNPPSRRNITVTPLSGRLWNGRLWEIGSSATQLEQPLNADYSALILAVGLYAGHASGIRFSQISHPLYVADKSQAELVMKTNCAFLPDGGWNWELDPPNRAFVGIGVVDPNSGHRMARELKNRSEEPPFDQLKAVRLLLDAQKLPYFGDVANRLFPALPLPSALAKLDVGGFSHLTEAYQRLMTEIAQLNQKAIAMRWSHLHDISSVVAIAGGRLKVNVLWTVLLSGLLHPKQKVVTEVVTDTSTAKELLKAKRNYENSTPAAREWYAQVSKDLFSDEVGDKASHKPAAKVKASGIGRR